MPIACAVLALPAMEACREAVDVDDVDVDVDADGSVAQPVMTSTLAISKIVERCEPSYDMRRILAKSVAFRHPTLDPRICHLAILSVPDAGLGAMPPLLCSACWAIRPSASYQRASRGVGKPLARPSHSSFAGTGRTGPSAR